MREGGTKGREGEKERGRKQDGDGEEKREGREERDQSWGGEGREGREGQIAIDIMAHPAMGMFPRATAKGSTLMDIGGPGE